MSVMHQLTESTHVTGTLGLVVREVLGVAGEPLGVVAVGHAASQPAERAPRDPEEFVLRR